MIANLPASLHQSVGSYPGLTPRTYADRGNTMGAATAGVHAGPVLGSEIRFIPCADVVQTAEGNITSFATGKYEVNAAESKTWCMYGNIMTVSTQRRSRMRESFTYGSVRGRPVTVVPTAIAIQGRPARVPERSQALPTAPLPRKPPKLCTVD